MLKISSALKKTAEKTVQEILQVKAGESVLVVTNPDRELQQIAMAMVVASHDIGAWPNLVFQKPKTSEDFMEPHVLAAFKQRPDIYIGVNERSTGADAEGVERCYPGVKGHLAKHDLRFYLLEKKYMRAAWTAEVTVADFVRLNAVDYDDLGKLGRRLAGKLRQSQKIEVHTGRSDILEVDISVYKPWLDDARYSRPGSHGNLPSGEVFCSPVQGTAHGTVALDGVLTTVFGHFCPRAPVRVTYDQGQVVRVSGGKDADVLKRNFAEVRRRANRLGQQGKITKKDAAEYARNATALGEVGIGLNRQARIYPGVGAMEAEKVYGSMHFAFGQDYDGQYKALNHQDCVVSNPTAWLVYANGRREKILENTKILL